MSRKSILLTVLASMIGTLSMVTVGADQGRTIVVESGDENYLALLGIASSFALGLGIASVAIVRKRRHSDVATMYRLIARATKQCPFCGRRVPIEAKWCPYCGHYLGETIHRLTESSNE